MRVALLVSTLAFLAGSPAFAQCVYVACNGGAPSAPAYQQPIYQAPSSQMPAPAAPPSAANGYDESYAAGLAARPAPGARPAARATRTASTRTTSQSYAKRAHTAPATKRRASVATTHRTHETPVTKRRVAFASHTAQVRRQPPRLVTPTRHASHRTSNNRVTATSSSYQDQIKDRAATYRPAAYGQSTSIASMMSRSGSYSSSSTTTWSGPANIVRQGGQVCGWGAQIVTNSQGYAQRQAVWVCQCPQGWRPPGY